MIRNALLAFVAVGCGGGSASPDARVDAGPDLYSFGFMAGDWEVTSRRSAADGGVVETAARSTIRPSLGVAWKEQLIGERDGVAGEVGVLYGRSDRPPAWLMARGDGAAGTFDVLEGTLAAGRAELISRDGSRPDGGRTRVTLVAAGGDAFELTLEEVTGGDGFVLVETLSYRRAGAGFVLPAPPAEAAGCVAPEYHQLDFWLGDWDVMGARNDIRSVLGGCIVEENWTGSELGTSFNMYDRRTAEWTQVWLDTFANNLVMHGGWDGERMSFESRAGPLPRRLLLTPRGDGTVRQRSEYSLDGGATFMLNFDYLYRER
jgi:hypothetical protein